MNKLVLSGVLIGVDFTKAGEFTNSEGDLIKYGDSVKLKINLPYKVIKQGIETNTISTIELKIVVDGSLEESVSSYNKMIGKLIEADLNPKDGEVYKTLAPRVVTK